MRKCSVRMAYLFLLTRNNLFDASGELHLARNVRNRIKFTGRIKAHTDWTRIGNATRIFNFQWYFSMFFKYSEPLKQS